MSVIEVENVSKRFNIVREEQGQRSVLERLKIIEPPKKTIWALKDVSFEVNSGEWLGIVGENGSGKSTLLKVMAGVLYPTQGSVNIEGDVASVLSLSSGFMEELTARENIYLYGSLMGLSKREIDKKYEKIVSFSELYDYMDTKYKKLSDGMKMRLAFSTAMSVESDIFLSDEVFAVGDGDFQEKCLERVENLKEEGKTIVLVSHNLNRISQWCDRALFLDEGQVKEIGDAKDVVDKYRNFLVWKGNNENFRRDNRKLIDDCEMLKTFKLTGENGKESYIFNSDDVLKVQLETNAEVEEIRMVIKDKISGSSKAEMVSNAEPQGPISLEENLGPLHLESGDYTVSLLSGDEEILSGINMKIKGKGPQPDFLIFTNPDERLEVNGKLFCLGKKVKVEELISDNCIFAHKKIPERGRFEEGFLVENGEVTQIDLSPEEIIEKFKEEVLKKSEEKMLKEYNDSVIDKGGVKCWIGDGESEGAVFPQGESFCVKAELKEDIDQGKLVLRRDDEVLLSIFSKARGGKNASVLEFFVDSLYLDKGEYKLFMESRNEKIINNLKIKIVEGKKKLGSLVLIADDLENKFFPEGVYYAFGKAKALVKDFEGGRSIPVYHEDIIDLDEIKNTFGKGKKLKGGR